MLTVWIIVLCCHVEYLPGQLVHLVKESARIGVCLILAPVIHVDHLQKLYTPDGVVVPTNRVLTSMPPAGNVGEGSDGAPELWTNEELDTAEDKEPQVCYAVLICGDMFFGTVMILASVVIIDVVLDTCFGTCFAFKADTRRCTGADREHSKTVGSYTARRSGKNRHPNQS